jgi:protein TonB
MRYALGGSALVHAAIFGTALIGFAWPEPDDAPAPGALTVDIVTISNVSTNSTEVLTSSAPQNLVSAGAEASPPVLEAIKPQTTEQLTETVLEPIEPEAVQTTSEALPPTEPEQIKAMSAPSVEPAASIAQSEILTTAMLAAEPAEAVAPVAVEPASPENQSAVIAPQSVTDAKVAPMPQTLSFKRPSAPTPREPAQPQREIAQQKPAPSRQRPPSQAGNGGQNQADAAAAPARGQGGGAGSGGSADTASWERQVQRRLNGALRYPRSGNGARGEVVVRFTVAAQGDASGMRVVQSSGNPVLDQAALDTVSRAAPFPPIPAGAGFAHKTFDFPLGFVRN